MTKPLPCPWCGHEADAGRIGTHAEYFKAHPTYAVTCSNDECPVESQATDKTLEGAIALWNRRAPVNSAERIAA